MSLLEVIKNFTKKNLIYAPSTIRSYRAWLKAVVVDQLENSKINADEANQCLNLLSPKNAPEPMPKKKGAKKRTSAKKAKSIKELQRKQLLRALKSTGNRDDLLLADTIKVMCLFGCRPSELQTMKIIGDDVIFRNGKNTNGRANGETRRIVGAAKSDGRKDFLNAFNTDLHLKIEAVDWDRLVVQMNARLAYMCKKLKIQRKCLYTFRHCAIAALKCVKPADHVAAIVGHGSNKTAGTHYAQSRTSLKFLKEQINYEAAPENVANVTVWSNVQRPEHAMNRSRKLSAEDEAEAKFIADLKQTMLDLKNRTMPRDLEIKRKAKEEELKAIQREKNNKAAQAQFARQAADFAKIDLIKLRKAHLAREAAEERRFKKEQP